MKDKYNLIDKDTGKMLEDCEWDLEGIQTINESLDYRFKIVKVMNNE